jgi:hypothetical protein
MLKKSIAMATASIQINCQDWINLHLKTPHTYLLFFLFISLVNGAAFGSDMKFIKQQDIKLPYQIYSNPVILRSTQSNGLAMALVTGESIGDYDKYTAVDAYQFTGTRLPGFPVMRHKGPHFEVAPANQIAAADYDNDGTDEILIMDVEGTPHYLRQNGSKIDVNTTANPTQGVLAWPPVTLSAPGKSGLTLLSLEEGPMTDSQPRLGLVNFTGQQYPGFPAKLSGPPERNAPIVLVQEDRIFVWLESGKVDGFAISSGQRLTGFPTASIGESVPANIRHMTYLAAAKRIFASSNANSLTSIDPMTGKLETVTVPGARQLTGLASTENQLYAYDQSTGHLIVLDATGKVIAKQQLDIASGAELFSLQVQTIQDTGKIGVFLITANPDNPEAKIDALYQQHAPEETKKKFKAAAHESAVVKYDSDNPNNPLQQQHEETRLKELKRGFLERKIGGIALAGLIFGKPETNITALIEHDGQIQNLLNDIVTDFTPATGYLNSPSIAPTLYIEAKTKELYYLVGLNNADQKLGSLVKVYQATY